IVITVAAALLLVGGVQAGLGLASARRPLPAGWIALAWGFALLAPWPLSFTVTQPAVVAVLAEALPFWTPIQRARMPNVNLADLDLAAKRSFRPLRDQIGAAHPPVPSLALGPSRPSVLVVIVESFRRDALDARYLPRTSAWVDGHAVRFDRHYAAANTT